MSLFARRTAHREERALVMPTGPSWPLVNTYAGKSVGFDSAMKNAAANACIRVLTASIVSLPVDVVRVQRGRRSPVSGADQPQIIRQPSLSVSARTWRGQVVRSIVGAGNAYGLVREQDGQGRPTRIDTVHPDAISWISTGGTVEPMLGGERMRLHSAGGDLWHLPVSWLTPPGQPYALSPVDLAKEAIGTGLAAEEFGARFFGDGGLPTAIIKSQQNLTREQAQAIKDAYRAMIAGRREPAVFGKDLDLEQVTVKPAESQFIDLLQFEVLQACRFWGVPPAMVFAAVSGQSVTYANITDADLFFLKHSLSHWLTDLEAAMSEMIVAPQVVKFNVDALMRMDTLKRYQVHEIALRTKTRTVNEVRRLEDEEPFDDPIYDEPGVPGGVPAATPDPSPSGAAV